MQDKKIGIKIVVAKEKDEYVAFIDSNIATLDMLSAYGVSPVHKAKSGWQALSKMAENWRRAGFME